MPGSAARGGDAGAGAPPAPRPRRCRNLKRALMLAVEDLPRGEPGMEGCGVMLLVALDEDARYIAHHGLDTLFESVVSQLVAEKPSGDVAGFIAQAVVDAQLRRSAGYAALERLQRQVMGRQWLTPAAATVAPDAIVTAAQQYMTEVEAAVVSVGGEEAQKRAQQHPLCSGLSAHLRGCERCYSLLQEVRTKRDEWMAAPWRTVDYAAMQGAVQQMRDARAAFDPRWRRSEPCAEIDAELARVAEAAALTTHLLRSDSWWEPLGRHAGAAWTDAPRRDALPLAALAAAYSGDGRRELVQGIRAEIVAAQAAEAEAEAAREAEEAEANAAREAEEAERKAQEKERAARRARKGR